MLLWKPFVWVWGGVVVSGLPRFLGLPLAVGPAVCFALGFPWVVCGVVVCVASAGLLACVPLGSVASIDVVVFATNCRGITIFIRHSKHGSICLAVPCGIRFPRNHRIIIMGFLFCPFYYHYISTWNIYIYTYVYSYTYIYTHIYIYIFI